MGTKRKIQQRTVESKKKLLDSAYTLFAEKDIIIQIQKKSYIMQAFLSVIFITIIRIKVIFTAPY